MALFEVKPSSFEGSFRAHVSARMVKYQFALAVRLPTIPEFAS